MLQSYEICPETLTNENSSVSTTENVFYWMSEWVKNIKKRIMPNLQNSAPYKKIFIWIN